MNIPTVFADFNNADKKGRLQLITAGTTEDIERKDVKLTENLQVLLTDYDGLATTGRITYSDEEDIWVAEIDWDDLQ